MQTVDTYTPGADSPIFLTWLRVHGIAPRDTFRLEIAGAEMTVFQYARDASGRKYVGADGEAAMLQPFRVALRCPPPLPGGTVVSP